MDTTQWPQGIGVVNKPMMESSRAMARPQKDQALNCPRCNSTNTKFCYYNNYSLSQPRYFCKTCRRYWTDGGSLRNVPVGGGSRKNRRSSSSTTLSPSSPSPSSSKTLLPDHHHHLNITTTPPGFLSSSASQHPKIHEGQDLNLAFPPPPEDYNNNNSNSMSEFADLPYNGESKPHLQNTNPSSSSSSHHHLSAMELLKSTGIASRGLGSFMAMPGSDSNSIYSSGFPLQEFKPSLNFSLDGFQSGYGSLQGVQESGARMLFPFEDLKQVSNTNEFDQQSRGGVQGDSSGYWNGMLGGGSW